MDQIKLDFKVVTQKIKDELIRLRRNHRIVSALFEILEQKEGKKLGKRITDVIKIMINAGEKDGYIVYFEDRYGMLHLSVWGKDIPYDNKVDLFLGYVSRNPEKRVDMKFIREHNAGWLKGEATANMLEKRLPDLKFIIDHWNREISELHSLINDVSHDGDGELYAIRSLFTENLKQQIL